MAEQPRHPEESMAALYEHEHPEEHMTEVRPRKKTTESYHRNKQWEKTREQRQSLEKFAFWMMDFVEHEVIDRTTMIQKYGHVDAMNASKEGNDEAMHKAYRMASEELGVLKGVLKMARWVNSSNSWNGIRLLNDEQLDRLNSLISATEQSEV